MPSRRILPCMIDSWSYFFLITIATGLACLDLPALPSRRFSAAFAFFALLIILSWKVIVYPKLFSPLRYLPGPKGGSFFHGQLWKILVEPPGLPAREWINTVPNEGIIRFTTVCNQERLLLTTPETLNEVMISRAYDWDKPKQLRESLGRIVGHGLLVASGKAHKLQRKTLLPAFSHRHLRGLHPIVWGKAHEMADALSAAVDGKSEPHTGTTIFLEDWLRRVTLDIIGLAGMGYDFRSLKSPDNGPNVAYRRVFNTPANSRLLTFIETMENLVPVAWLSRLPFKYNKDVDAGVDLVRAECRGVITQKQVAGATTGRKDILSVAVASGLFDEAALIDQTMTFLAAGHETVFNAITWAVAALCRHADVHARLKREVRGAGLPQPAANRSSTIVAEDLARLPYLSAVCNEVLRVYAPIPLTRRESVCDTTICSHRIPRGTAVLIAPTAINMSKQLWGDDALEFNPDRWMDTSSPSGNGGGATSSLANLTFLHGPRSCIGATFAKAELAWLVAALILRFDISFVDPDHSMDAVSGGITYKLKGELKINLRCAAAPGEDMLQ